MSTGSDPPWCGQCPKNTRLMNTPDGPKRCPACNPLADKPLPQHKHCPRCLLLVHVWDAEACGQHEPIREITTERTT